ncbi:aromatic ring-hydroxylating oxygenase subunit alpha [Paenibacillus rigui]|uniref:(2Fe-2S)-binding protein n=1 Tax=Paenibacillus rigui TaxID=554312 RepID=A0A229UWQ5_9BACL|nr:aromatic ring-hydroxylating dioxygenase subunit alpha [Paenibacillus rigui]OXM87763.1 (2Fe-2S)-binding protein [Paenibacillus rigui]
MLVRDMALLKEWHPVMRSDALGDQPVAVDVLGEKVVVFRTSNGVHAFKDLCIHRGVPLSLGRVDGDELVCAYHGWRYNGCGQCTRIPSLSASQSIPSKAHAFAYECKEARGILWVSLGEPEEGRHPLIDQPLESGHKEIAMGPYTLQAAGPRVIENFLDVSHFMFVHEGLLGDSAFPEIEDYHVHEVNGVLRSDEIVVYQPDPDGTGRGVYSHYVYEVFSPFCAAFTKRSRDSSEFMRLYLAVLPEANNMSTAFMVSERNYMLDEADELFIRFQDKLIEQDRLMLENQKPELLPLDLQAELHLKCDRISIAYRKKLREWGVTFGTE